GRDARRRDPARDGCGPARDRRAGPGAPLRGRRPLRLHVAPPGRRAAHPRARSGGVLPASGAGRRRGPRLTRVAGPPVSAYRGLMDRSTIATSIGLPVAAAALGSVATRTGMRSRWYRRLDKPRIQPPPAV